MRSQRPSRHSSCRRGRATSSDNVVRTRSFASWGPEKRGERPMARSYLLLTAVIAALALAAVTSAARGGDPPVTSGNPLPFPQGAQNEFTIAVDPNPGTPLPAGQAGPALAAGANDYIDQPPCSGGTCK